MLKETTITAEELNRRFERNKKVSSLIFKMYKKGNITFNRYFQKIQECNNALMHLCLLKIVFDFSKEQTEIEQTEIEQTEIEQTEIESTETESTETESTETESTETESTETEAKEIFVTLINRYSSIKKDVKLLRVLKNSIEIERINSIGVSYKDKFYNKKDSLTTYFNYDKSEIIYLR